MLYLQSSLLFSKIIWFPYEGSSKQNHQDQPWLNSKENHGIIQSQEKQHLQSQQNHHSYHSVKPIIQKTRTNRRWWTLNPLSHEIEHNPHSTNRKTHPSVNPTPSRTHNHLRKHSKLNHRKKPSWELILQTPSHSNQHQTWRNDLKNIIHHINAHQLSATTSILELTSENRPVFMWIEMEKS